MRTTIRPLIAIVIALVVAAGCGSDDGGPSSGFGDSPPAPDADAGIGEDDFIVPETSDDDDLATQLLGRLFGLPAGFLTADQRACVSDELAPVFPDGVVPEGTSLTEEIADAMDDAGVACGIDFQP